MIIIRTVLFLLTFRNVHKIDAVDLYRQNYVANGVGNWVTEADLVTPNLLPINELPNVALFDDAQHRGPKWYDDISMSQSTELGTSDGSASDLESSNFEAVSDDSSSASSFETNENKKAHRVYRECTPCPQDMMKSYKNVGIKWICGGYQRARRSFKSECMMRYRNCEDGTMFVKLSDHRCKNDSYHGHHWFYIYRT